MNSHGIEEHTDKLEEENDGRLCSVSRLSINITEAASGESSGHKVNSNDVLVLAVVNGNIPGSHPRDRVVSPVLAKHYHQASQKVQTYQS